MYAGWYFPEYQNICRQLWYIPEGAFVPLDEEIIDIKGTVEKTYEIEPLLRVKWVGEPQVNADGTVEVKVIITRGTNNPDYQQPLTELGYL